MDTNLYDILNYMLAGSQHPKTGEYHSRATIVLTRGQYDWLKSYLRNPGTLIEFRSRPTGRMVPVVKPPISVLLDVLAPTRVPDEQDEPEMEQHYALAGEAEEVFQLLTEAMLLNPTFASLVVAAGRYYTTHVPLCRRCSQRHNGRLQEDCPDVVHPRWEFKPRPQ